jgi:hypothetical protein
MMVPREQQQQQQMTVAQRDMHLMKINDEIKNRRQLLLDKKKELEQKEKLNEFLATVRQEYRNYYNYIIHEKQQQYEALKLLKTYLDDLDTTEKSMNNKMRNANYDQNQILEEMNKIRTELDGIIKQTGTGNT